MNGKVIIGNGGADFGARGFVTAFDANTGKQLWRFYTVPGTEAQNKGDPVMEKAAATWSPDFWKKGGGGGGPWDSITFDPELNRIYVGTANAYSYDPEERSPGGGDNLYTASIVALDADTGKYVWHYQQNPNESWDYKATANMISATLNIGGKRRKVLMQAPKNGFFYVLDRETGKLISAEKVGKATWADHIDLKTGRPVEEKNIRYETGDVTIWPGSLGAHSWQSMSYSPKAGLVYIPYMQLGVQYSKGKPIPGGVFVGGLGIKEAETDPADGKGALVAWDPVKQRAAWRAPLDTLFNGGVLSTAGDVVFWGGADGHLRAYNATSGKQLWDYNAGMGIMAAPMSWSKDGKQYVSVLTGYGASAAIWSGVMNVGWKYSAPRRLLTFTLDGKAVLPPSPPRDTTIHPVDDPKLKLDPAQVEAGHQLFLACAACHGRSVVGAGGPGPDLRESQAALDPNVLYSIVHDGALIENGMPKLPFPRQQTDAIWAYIRDAARKAAVEQQAQAPATGQAH
jgi:quinohemoprotein ethanol dehydrogenase